MGTTKWRAKALTPYGTGAVSLSQIQLYAGATRVDTAATISCSHTPSSGALANLQDSDTSTLCTFERADCTSAGFWIHWELTSAADVTGIRVGSGAAQNTFLSHLDLQFWSGSRWEPMGTVGRFAWPGANAVSTEIVFTALTNLTVALLHMDGTNGQNSGWADSSVQRVLFSNQSGTSYSTTAFKFGSTSLSIPALWNYAYFGAAGSPLFDLQTEDFGIDLWVRASSIAHVSNAPCLFSCNDGPRAGGYGLYLTNGKPEFFVENGVLGNLSCMATTTVALNTWYHIAVSREGNVFRIFVNGVLENTVTHATACVVSPTRPCVLGSYFYGGGQNGPFTGYIDELRIVKGRAPWTASFLPPSAAYESMVGALPLPSAHAGMSVYSMPGVALSFSPVGVAGYRVSPGRDHYFGGDGVLYGATEVDGTPDFPKVCKVRLQRERDGYTVSEQWSKPDGTWRFEHINRAEVYCVQAFDHTHDYRATLADKLTPEQMA